ncbi:GNAT family N-acetyltransferase [Agrobacterium sp. LC34]|uniref:GNAT family N-acetyltransferase n=1 Tax=Agrobacterium sp. LC34 TaxID=1643810 RepID=UPI001FED8AC5|nr:GNAT family N-acetyltransferase [Agrobacterium sp. LC34]
MPGEKAKLWQRRLTPSIDPERLVITLAEVHSGLAGFACFALDEETDFGTYLHNLYVDRSFQGKRLGPRLLIESISRFSEERWAEPVHRKRCLTGTSPDKRYPSKLEMMVVSSFMSAKVTSAPYG